MVVTPHRRWLQPVVVFGLVVATSFGARGAEPAPWTVVNASGTALVLVGEQWQVISPGDVVVDKQPFRTLRSGRLALTSGAEKIELSGNTAAEIGNDGGNTIVIQYSGELAVNSDVGSTGHLIVEAATLAISVTSGELRVAVTDGRTKISVGQGEASIVDHATGHHVVLSAGQSVTGYLNGTMQVAGTGELPKITDAAGEVVVAATGTTLNETKGNGNANGNSSNSNGNSGGNGNGNSGNNGNGNGGNNGNGKGNGKS